MGKYVAISAAVMPLNFGRFAGNGDQNQTREMGKSESDNGNYVFVALGDGFD